MLFSLFYFYIGYSSKCWSITSGTVTHSCIVTRKNKYSKHGNHHPTIYYEYEVNDKKYKSNRIGSFLGFDPNLAFAEKIINQFPENKLIKIYYCPYFHNLSVLITGMKQLLAHSILLFTSAILILASYLALFTNNPNWFVNLIFGLHH